MEFKIMKYFKYDHLPERLQKISKPYADLAELVVSTVENNDIAEKTVALRKLLESKDAAVRAHI